MGYKDHSDILQEQAEIYRRHANMLEKCAKDGHSGVNIATDGETDTYLCERCMATYTEPRVPE